MKKQLLLLLFAFLCSVGMWADNVTSYVMKSYDATNKIYTATDDQEGVWSLSTSCSTSNQLPANWSTTTASDRGICFSTPSNVTVTSKTSFNGVTKIVVEASSNIGSGTGTLDIKVGTTSLGSKNLSKTNHTTYEFTSATPLSGIITLTINQGKNSVWIGGFKVTTIPADPYTVTFNAGTNGTCSTTSLKEASAGAGVKLPSCTANTGYKFLGWTATKDNTTIDKDLTAGATYKPTANTTLYAVYEKLYQVTYSQPANGTLAVTCSGEDVVSGNYYSVGQKINIVATPNDGYKFNKIIVNDGEDKDFSSPKEWTMGAKDITISAVFDEIIYHTITWSVNGNTSTITPSQVEDGENITFPTNLDDIYGKKFMGWSANPTASSASDIIKGAVAASANATYYAVYAKVTSGAEEWEKITNSNNVTEGVYAIISFDEDYYLANAKTTSNAPSVTAITKTDNKIDIKADMKWNLTIDTNGSYIFESASEEGCYLWGANTNEGIRIIEQSAKSSPFKNWKLESTSNYGLVLKDNGTTGRYLSTYGQQDWRNYTSTSTTNRAANIYKVVGGTTYSDYTTIVAAPSYSEVKSLNVTADNDKDYFFTTFSSDKVTFFPEYDEELTFATAIKTAVVDGEEFILPTIATGTATIDEEEVEGYFVPANTGVLVQAEYDGKAEQNVPYYEVENMIVKPLADNDLYAGNGETLPEGKVWFKLAWGDEAHTPSTLGFYYGAADGVPFVSTKGKAYLGLTPEQANSKIYFSLDEEVTGIKAIETVNGASVAYNLAGQRVSANQKGIVIVNGKKFINK